MSNTSWHLNINDKARTIQNIRIPNKKAFNIIKSTVNMECTEGWKPTSDDISKLVHGYYHPSSNIIKSISDAKKEFGR